MFITLANWSHKLGNEGWPISAWICSLVWKATILKPHFQVLCIKHERSQRGDLHQCQSYKIANTSSQNCSM